MKAFWLIPFACVALVGCLGPQSARLQSADENEPKEPREPEIPLVANRASFNTSFSHQDDIDVIGVGLVVGLNHTGGGAPPASYWRDCLEQDLKKKGIENFRSVIDSPSCAMVMIKARIPRGTRRNEPIDLQVELPQGSHCTSLKGGYLTSCELFTFESTRQVSPASRNPERWFRGNAAAKAEGQLVTGLGGSLRLTAATSTNGDAEYQNEDPSDRVGQVFGGGRCLGDPPLLLIMNQNYQESRFAAQITDRINMTFPGMKYGRDGLASAKNSKLIALGVPLQYRHDLEHYQLVLAAIPVNMLTPQQMNAYRQHLAEQLLDPLRAQLAAIKLEALGEDSAPALRTGLSATHPLSRFAAALSLTYLRKRDGVDELTKLARQEPTMRATCLAALASLDESICHTRLADLLSEPNAELRYGAFRSLQALDERSPEIGGEKCREAYWIHQVSTDSTPMVHYLSKRRAEIVLFGTAPVFLPGFRMSFGSEFTIAVNEDGICRLSRFAKEVVQKQCPAQVADVLRTLAEMDGGYAEAIDLLVKADANHKLSCELQHDKLPQMVEPAKLQNNLKEAMKQAAAAQPTTRMARGR